jgi:hypothetical protein
MPVAILVLANHDNGERECVRCVLENSVERHEVITTLDRSSAESPATWAAGPTSEDRIRGIEAAKGSFRTLMCEQYCS